MTAKPAQLLKVFYQRQFRWTRFGNGWIILRPWLRIAPFFLFGLTHVNDNSPISVLVVNLGVWSMLEAAYRSGVLSWRYFEKEEFLVKRYSLRTFYLYVGSIEASTVLPLVLVAGLIEGSVQQSIRALIVLPVMVLAFSPFVIALGDLSQRVSTKFWDLKFIGGYIISSLIFAAPVLRPFQSVWGVELLVWNPIGLPFWFGRSYVLSSAFSVPFQTVLSYSILVVLIAVTAIVGTVMRRRRRAVLTDVSDGGLTMAQPRIIYQMDDELEPIGPILPSSSDARFRLSDHDSGVDLLRIVIGENGGAQIRRESDIRINLDVFNHSVGQGTYPRLHFHKHDGKHIFSLTWPDGQGLQLPRGRVTQISTKLPKQTLGPGTYFVSLDICTYDPFRRFLTTPPLVRFDVIDSNSELPETQRSPHDRKGYFQPYLGWQTQSLSIDEYSSPRMQREFDSSAV